MIGFAESRATRGHSDEGRSLLLDDGSAFTGDLTPVVQGDHEAGRTAAASGSLLRERGAIQIYPGHGPIRPVQA